MENDAPDTIPIFPLANVVLFPTISVPLYIFEPRYRQMTQAALDGDRRIGMVAVKPEHQASLAGDPEVFAIGCEGTITHAEQRPDGTWNILLAATQRFRILDEPTRPESQLYRSARVELIEEAAVDGQTLRALRGDIRDRLAEILDRLADQRQTPESLERLDELDDPRFVNVLAQALDFGVLEKQRLLESPGHLERATTLRDLLLFRLAELGNRSGSGSSQLH